MPHRARKRFGQNFLQDGNVIARIINAIHPTADQHLMEIGPGLGALTVPLLRCCASLTAVDIDRDIVSHLTRQFADQPKLSLIQADALQLDFQALINRQTPADTPAAHWRMVGNLPYNIATPLLFRLFGVKHLFTDMHVMLQKEVVARMSAPPGAKPYGRLSVMTQYHCATAPLFTVNSTAFHPKPAVESAMIRLKPHTAPPGNVDNREHFATLVALAFGQRRKTLRRIFKGRLAESDYAALAIDPQTRPEQLDLSAFAALSNRLNRRPAT